MPGHHSSSHHSSSHHSSSHHSTTHHSSPTHHMHTTHRSFRFGSSGGVSTGFSLWRTLGCFVVLAGIIVVPIFLIIGAANNAVNSVTSSFSSSDSSANVASDPTVVADLAIMNGALDNRMALWEKQSDTLVHHISASEANLPADFNTKEVVYGHCTTAQFYTFILNITPPEDTTADTEGYEYVPGSSPGACSPTGWHIMSSDNVAPDWYFVTIDTTQATAQPSSGG